jgi:hypothetical protein
VRIKALLFSVLALPLLGIAPARPDPPLKPEYCWLVFGPQSRRALLVCLDQEAVTLEEYLDGRPNGQSHRFRHRSECSHLALADPDGETSYVIMRMSGTAARAVVPAELMVHVDIQGPVVYGEYCDIVKMSDHAERAPVAHFHAPLRIEAQTILWKLPPDLALKPGAAATDLRAFIGTMDAEKGCWVVVRTHADAAISPVGGFGEGVHPFVDVEFPPRKNGDPPIRKRYALDQFC